MHYLNLIRYKNLLMIAGLQILVKYSLIEPILSIYNVTEYRMSGFNFTLIMLATLFIAAGGYVINDYFDTKIDNINRPEKVIVGKLITKELASRLHQVLTGIGVLLGLYVAFAAKSLPIAVVVAMVTGLLWFYSASYKRQFLVGNIIVGLNTALIPIIIALAEIGFLMHPDAWGDLLLETPVPSAIYGWTIGIAAFAFIATLIREIIKDMEDIEGDKEMELRTVPIVWGINKAKILVYGLSVLMLAGLFQAKVKFIDIFYSVFGAAQTDIFGDVYATEAFVDTITTRYFIFGIGIPSLMMCVLLFFSKKQKDLHNTASMMKFIMLIGMLYTVFFYYLMAKNQGIEFFNLFMVK